MANELMSCQAAGSCLGQPQQQTNHGAAQGCKTAAVGSPLSCVAEADLLLPVVLPHMQACLKGDIDEEEACNGTMRHLDLPLLRGRVLLQYLAICAVL